MYTGPLSIAEFHNLMVLIHRHNCTVVLDGLAHAVREEGEGCGDALMKGEYQDVAYQIDLMLEGPLKRNIA